MKTKISIIIPSLVIIAALSIAAVILYADYRAETKFTFVTGTIHHYAKKVKEIKLEELGTNLALNMEANANDFTQDKTPNTATDGNVQSYWEGAADAYPNMLTVDMKSVRNVKAIRIKLNPDTIWEKRTQTFSVLSSTDGNKFTGIVPSADYIFDPEENLNTVTVKFGDTKAQYIRLNFTANTAATAGQVAEIEIY